MSENFGNFTYLGSIEILQSLSKVAYSKQSAVIRRGIQKGTKFKFFVVFFLKRKAIKINKKFNNFWTK